MRTRYGCSCRDALLAVVLIVALALSACVNGSKPEKTEQEMGRTKVAQALMELIPCGEEKANAIVDVMGQVGIGSVEAAEVEAQGTDWLIRFFSDGKGYELCLNRLFAVEYIREGSDNFVFAVIR